MAVVEAAWLAGDMGEAQVAVLAEARRCERRRASRATRPCWWARPDLRYRHFAKHRGLLVPAGRSRRAPRTRPRPTTTRRLHLSQSWQGRWFLDGILDPIGGAIFANTLERIEQELFEADWAEAKARVGDERQRHRPGPHPGPAPGRRRGGDGPAGGGDARGIRDGPSRCSPCSWATRPSPGGSASWPAAPWSAPAPGAVAGRGLGGAGGLRRPRPHQERGRAPAALRRGHPAGGELRDRECFHQFCDQPAEDCEIDHVQPCSEGGLTIDENGRPACSWHNRWRQREKPPP